MFISIFDIRYVHSRIKEEFDHSPIKRQITLCRFCLYMMTCVENNDDDAKIIERTINWPMSTDSDISRRVEKGAYGEGIHKWPSVSRHGVTIEPLAYSFKWAMPARRCLWYCPSFSINIGGGKTFLRDLSDALSQCILFNKWTYMYSFRVMEKFD